MADSPLGTSDEDLIEAGKHTISGVLQDFGNKLQDDLRRSLQQKITTVTPKTLEQSIVFDIKFLGSSYSFKLKMEDYWKFVDEGVQGIGGVKADGTAWIPNNTSSQFRFGTGNFKGTGAQFKESTDKWANNNGFNPFALRKSIFHRGTRATNFYSEVVDQKLIDDLVKDLERVGGREIEISIKNSFNGVSN